MFHARVGEAIRLRAAFIESKVGKTGLTVTLDLTDESGNATTGLSASAGAVAGEYYYVLTPDAAGMWLFCFKTSTTTVDQQHLFGVIAVEAALTTARAAKLDYLDASIAGIPALVWSYTTRALNDFTTLANSVANAVWSLTARTLSSHGLPAIGTAVWATSTRTLTDYGSLVSDIATAVWGAGARTLTSFGTLVTDIWNQVLTSLSIPFSASAYLKASGAATDPLLNPVPGSYPQGTAGAVLGALDPANVTVSSPVSIAGDALELVRGDDYALVDGRALSFSSEDWPNLAGATSITLTVRRRVEAFGTGADSVLFDITDTVASRVTGTGLQTVVFEPTAAKTLELEPGTLSGKFDIQAVLATTGHIVTLVLGKVTVLEDQTRP